MQKGEGKSEFSSDTTWDILQNNKIWSFTKQMSTECWVQKLMKNKSTPGTKQYLFLSVKKDSKSGLVNKRVRHKSECATLAGDQPSKLITWSTCCSHNLESDLFESYSSGLSAYFGHLHFCVRDIPPRLSYWEISSAKIASRLHSECSPNMYCGEWVRAESWRNSGKNQEIFAVFYTSRIVVFWRERFFFFLHTNNNKQKRRSRRWKALVQ